ncbi:unnamed protein product [Cylindrotheca closterium]|uniref:Uncharacterized protein n=1 Tax=Cylindrotheca closterium TaxID=2856 RepID=A0AAD2JJZ2_9STRA|nr:unnamed protein product [Cylindrotheca closterium]
MVVLYPTIGFPDMFKFAPTTSYISCTLFKIHLLIKATPAQADKASAAAKEALKDSIAQDDCTDDETDAEGVATSNLGSFKPVTKKK